MPWDNTPAGRRKSDATYGNQWRQARKLALQNANGRCQKCGATSKLQVDHIIPVSQGGTHMQSNLQVLCSGPGSCHARKTANEGGGYRKPAQARPDPEPRPSTQW